MQMTAHLRHIAAVYRAEAARRPHQPDFAALLRQWADKAEADAIPAQGDLFATAQWGAAQQQEQHA